MSKLSSNEEINPNQIASEQKNSNISIESNQLKSVFENEITKKKNTRLPSVRKKSNFNAALADDFSDDLTQEVSAEKETVYTRSISKSHQMQIRFSLIE